jgi:hypothetical protein
MKQLTKVIVFRVFSVPKNGLEWIFKCFLIRKWFRIEFRVFSSENGSERNSMVLSFENVWNEIPRVFLFQEMGRNSEVFLFRETGGIPLELPSVHSLVSYSAD